MNVEDLITNKRLFKICQKNLEEASKYIIVRDIYNDEYGLNCGIINTKQVDKIKLKSTNVTRLVSWRKCNLMEYISLKLPLRR